MAMIKCKECGNVVSDAAAACPHCGAPIKKKKTSVLTWIVAVILGLWLFGFISSQIDNNGSTDSKTSSSAPSSKTYKIGETAHVGYTSYLVQKAFYRNTLSDNPYMNQAPDASYLFVEITVRNDDKEARTIAPFKLVDESGAKYETTSKAWSVNGSIGVLDSLNPGVQKHGYIVFDVPKGKHYKLEISGGYWSPDKAFVDLGL